MTGQPGKQLDIFRQRERKLQRWAWVSVLLPVALLAVLLVMVSKELRTLNQLRQQDKDLREQIDSNNRTLEEQQKKLASNSLALSAVKTQRSGPSPKIVYYRSPIGPQLVTALEQLGFKADQGDIQEKAQEANTTLSGKPVDTLIYGCAVSEQDIRLIAAALTNANLPIRRIAPTVKKKTETMLVQVVASKLVDSTKPALDPSTWKKTTDCSSK